MKLWFDINNTPQVHFMLALYRALAKEKGFDFLFTCRDFVETEKLLRMQLDQPFSVIGAHYGKNKAMKALGLLRRTAALLPRIKGYDVTLSCGSEAVIWSAWLKGKRSFAFGDNDTAPQWTYSRFVDLAFFPKAINPDIMLNQGFKASQLHFYNGYKEDIYLADYEPNPDFVGTLPFRDYVLVRAENVKANYIRNSGAKSIAADLMEALTQNGHNVLFLPRYATDRQMVDNITHSDRIFMPDAPINGLDAVFYSKAVLTGAGTLAREAACMGRPSVSFFLGRQLLAVDRRLVEEDRVFFSRKVDEIVQYVENLGANTSVVSNSREVKDEVVEVLLQRLQKR